MGDDVTVCIREGTEVAGEARGCGSRSQVSPRPKAAAVQSSRGRLAASITTAVTPRPPRFWPYEMPRIDTSEALGVRLRMSTGKHAEYRRLSQWRLGPKQQPRVFDTHQERSVVRRVGDVQLVCSTTKPHLKTATPDDVKILLTNAMGMSVTEVIELDSLRWQIELFFQERKSTLGFYQYRFQDFAAVRDRHYDSPVPGVRTRPTPDRPPRPIGRPTLVAETTPARPLLGVPPSVRQPRTEGPRRPPEIRRRHPKTQTPPHRRLTPRIQNPRLNPDPKNATSKRANEEVSCFLADASGWCQLWQRGV